MSNGWPDTEADAPMHGLIFAFLLAALLWVVGVGLVVVLS